MTDNEIKEILRTIRTLYPYLFRKMKKEDIIEYYNLFSKNFKMFDKELLNVSINNIAKTSKFAPSIAEVYTAVKEETISRQLIITKKMHDDGYYRKGLTGEDIERREFYKYDSILEQMENQKFKELTKKEIIDYVNKWNDLEYYRNKTLFYEMC